MKKVLSTQDRVKLYILKAKLAEAGIPTLIKNEEPTGPAAGEITPMVAWPELWIIDDQYEQEALQLIHDESIKKSHRQKNWQCPQCGEHLEGQFDVCWKCGHSKP